jgi:hypothetical protein
MYVRVITIKLWLKSKLWLLNVEIFLSGHKEVMYDLSIKSNFSCTLIELYTKFKDTFN